MQLGEKLLQCSTLAVTLNSGAKLHSWEVKVGIYTLQCCNGVELLIENYLFSWARRNLFRLPDNSTIGLQGRS